MLEVTSSGIPIVNLYNREDIEKVLRYPSKYPFRPPTEIVEFYRKMRPDRYASTGITNEWVDLIIDKFIYVYSILFQNTKFFVYIRLLFILQ